MTEIKNNLLPRPAGSFSSEAEAEAEAEKEAVSSKVRYLNAEEMPL